MSSLVLCTEPVPGLQCPEPFRLRASAWIDGSNFGSLSEQYVPAGIRLRWNLPFLYGESGPRRFPTRFRVKRSRGLTQKLFIPVADVGQDPTIFAPSELWLTATRGREGDNYLIFDEDSCNAASAIYFELEKRSPGVLATFFDISGKNLATAHLKGGDRFYIELADVKQIQFSSPPALVKPGVLFLMVSNDYDVRLETIADIDARAWLGASLNEVSSRYAKADGTPCAAVDEAAWDELRRSAAQIRDALDAGYAVTEEALDYVAVSASLKWDLAAIMGWSFLDGESPGGPEFDQIQLAKLLTKPSNDVFAYQVEALFKEGSVEQSSLFFTRAALMAPLTNASSEIITSPIVTLKSVGIIDIGPTPENPIKRPSLPDSKAYCRSTYRFGRTGFADNLSPTPYASASAFTGDVYDPPEHYLGDGSADGAPLLIREKELLEDWAFDYPIPFVDSEVWIRVAAGDHWGRTIPPQDTARIKPKFDYRDACVPILSGTCDETARTVTLSLDATRGWAADRLTRYLQGTIEFLMRRPHVPQIQLSVEIGQVFVHEGSVWAARLRTWNHISTEHRLIGGQLECQGLVFTITGFRHTWGDVYCLFEVDTNCGSGVVFAVPTNAFVPAQVSEPIDSRYLWCEVDEAPLMADGKPASYSAEIDLVAVQEMYQFKLSFSTTLHFASRLKATWSGEVLRGPMADRVAVVFIADRPEKQNVNLNITQLGVDFYGRSIVRAKADAMRYFDAGLLVKTSIMAGEITDTKSFSKGYTVGQFSAQEPFRRGTVFNSFTVVTQAHDGEAFTLGVNAVRPEDDMDSGYVMRLFFGRHPGN